VNVFIVSIPDISYKDRMSRHRFFPSLAQVFLAPGSTSNTSSSSCTNSINFNLNSHDKLLAGYPMGTHGTSHSYQQFSTSARILSDESSTNSINSNLSTDQTGRPIIDEVKIVNGLPQITVPLPSRNEKCVFSLKPVSNNVGDFLEMLKYEDRGIDSAFIKNTDGVRIAGMTSIQTLFDQEFDLYINNNVYRVNPPKIDSLSGEELKKISDVKYLISELYEALNIQDFHAEKETQLVKELETLKNELKPLEEQKSELEAWAEKRTSLLTWAGLGLMSVQFGVLARLTWWEYSWDIMEPVTYFVTYGTAIGAYSYFVITKQEYLFNDAAKRTWLFSFHKKADKHRWDVDKYNNIKQGILNVESDLRRLRAPLQTLHRPQQYLQQDGKSAGIFGIANLKDVLNKMQ